VEFFRTRQMSPSVFGDTNYCPRWVCIGLGVRLPRFRLGDCHVGDAVWVLRPIANPCREQRLIAQNSIKFAALHQCLAHLNSLFFVHIQQLHRGPANGCDANDLKAIECEVLMP